MSNNENGNGEDEAQRRPIVKTPMFAAMHAARYQRQTLIREIQVTNPTILCYVAGVRAQIDRIDTVGFVDMVHNLTPGQPVDLMLHTPGGDVDAAEKLIRLVRNKVTEEGMLRVIVPDIAKSAGTLMALGANTIIMSDSSELGPIDPQMPLKDANGHESTHSVLTYLRAYYSALSALKADPNDVSNRITFEKFDPTIISKFVAVRDRARTLAENLLSRRGLKSTKIAADLLDIGKYPSHGQMIGWEDAKNMGLNVEYRSPDDELWRKYWELYCHLRLAIDTDKCRIFESEFVSLPM